MAFRTIGILKLCLLSLYYLIIKCCKTAHESGIKATTGRIIADTDDDDDDDQTSGSGTEEGEPNEQPHSTSAIPRIFRS